MKNIRIIPRLDIKGPNVVKPIQTEALRVVGNPKELATRYYLEGADEIIYLDIVASLYQRNLNFDLLKSVTKDIFIPVTAGGGIRTIRDINYALRSGADKAAINTHLVRNPKFINEAVKEFGSQCIVLFIEAKKQVDGSYEVYTDGGRERTGLEIIDWAKKAVKLGVGEILISSIDKDGTKNGFDIELLKKINRIAPIPVIAHGGAGSLDSLKSAVQDGGADALGLSSILHYRDYSIKEIKNFLKSNNINVRIV